MLRRFFTWTQISMDVMLRRFFTWTQISMDVYEFLNQCLKSIRYGCKDFQFRITYVSG